MMVDRYPNLKEEDDGSIPGSEISSQLDGKLVRRSTASCALTLAYQPSVSKKDKMKWASWKHKRTKKSNHSKINPSKKFSRVASTAIVDIEHTSNQ